MDYWWWQLSLLRRWWRSKLENLNSHMDLWLRVEIARSEEAYDVAVVDDVDSLPHRDSW